MVAFAAISAVFFLPLPQHGVSNRSNQPASTSVAPNERGKGAPSTIILARLPERFSFASAPVLVSGGSEAVALLEPTEAGFGGSPLRLASIELQTGRVTVGPVVAGNTATLFTGSGQVFLLNLFGTPIGHVELWRVPSDLEPVLLARLPFTEKTTTIAEFGPTNPAIADALVPGKDQEWIADGSHILLVSLAEGHIVESRVVPSATEGNIWGLALATTSGPLYATFCRPRPGYLGDCGTIAEINLVNGSVISERWYNGAEQFGRYGIVATPAGTWLSAGGGGNGVWLDFFSKSGLRVTQIDQLIGFLSLVSVGHVVWGSFGGAGLLGCSTVSATGVPYTTMVDRNVILGAGYPLGLTSQDRLLVATWGQVQAGALVAVSVPRACASRG